MEAGTWQPSHTTREARGQDAEEVLKEDEGQRQWSRWLGRGADRNMAAISPLEGTRRQGGAIETGSRGKGGKEVRRAVRGSTHGQLATRGRRESATRS